MTLRRATTFPDLSQDTGHWPIIVLTLEGDDERAANLVGTLQKMCVSFQLFFGVDGRQGLAENEVRLIDRGEALRKHRRVISDVEFACALSHQQIYCSILANKWPGAIVLEDDAILNEAQFRGFIEQRSYEKANLILLDHARARTRRKKIFLGNNIIAYKLSMPSVLTTGYCISAEGARYLVNSGTPLSDLADWPGDITELEPLACFPKIVSHSDQKMGASHIRKHRTKAKRDSLRLLRLSYWKIWILKRQSTRIS